MYALLSASGFTIAGFHTIAGPLPTMFDFGIKKGTLFEFFQSVL